MEVGILAGVISFVASIIAIGISAGIQLGKIATLEARACEDRNSNKKKFAELYESRNDHNAELIEQSANIASICNQLQKIEAAVSTLDQKIDRLIERGNR